MLKSIASHIKASQSFLLRQMNPGCSRDVNSGISCINFIRYIPKYSGFTLSSVVATCYDADGEQVAE